MAKNRRPAEPLERGAVPWLLACAIATAAPHAEHLPYWLSALATLLLVWRSWLWHKHGALPPRWLLTVITVAACAGIVGEYKTLFGRDAGVALLFLFMALKPMEMRTQRDAIVVVMLGLFLLLTHYFYSQEIPIGLWLLAATVLEIATLIRIAGGEQPPRFVLRYAGLLLAQALPFMLILFLLFPRISGPLWGLPQDAHSSRTGLSDTMAPGSISNLIQNSDVAFRARFSESPPPVARLYWRGPVLDVYDGQTWQPTRYGNNESARIEARSSPLEYELTIEPHQQRWLLALDAPVSLPNNTRLGAHMETFVREPIRQRSRFMLRAALDYRVNETETRQILAAALRLPAEYNPKARVLAEQWATRYRSPEQIAAAALQFFREKEFIYTLQPPLLGKHAVDEFLFGSRRGFCEHYASAFVFLMRAAGVPSRVVTGYQGGEINPIDGYVAVRQSDAHAWAEIWVADKGWLRVDPTFAIAPSRIEQGIAAAVPAGDPLPILMRVDVDWLRTLRFRWDAINNAWNQWVLGYNPERQRQVLSRFGLGDLDWRELTALLAALCGFALLAVTAWTLWQRPRLDPAQRAWLRFCKRLAKHGVPRQAWEGPLDYAARAAAAKPDWAEIIRRAAQDYVTARYGADDPREALQRLEAARRQLPRTWSLT